MTSELSFEAQGWCQDHKELEKLYDKIINAYNYAEESDYGSAFEFCEEIEKLAVAIKKRLSDLEERIERRNEEPHNY